MYKVFLENEEKTKYFGEILGKNLDFGAIICLDGDLGAGKTCITKSIAKSIGIEEDITSPTFTIINEYLEPRILYHFDVYRIGSSEEMYDIGYEEYIDSGEICIIEWAKLIDDILPEERLDINIEYKDFGRELELIPKGVKYERLVKEVMDVFIGN